MSPPPTPAASASDAAAVPAHQSDQSQWFVREVHVHDGQLKAWLRSQYPHVGDVDDVVQESYLRVWKAKTLNPIRSAKSFLFQIARHVAVDLFRRHRASPVTAIGDLSALSVMDERPDAAAALTAKEKIDLLASALADLPTRCREVVFLHKLKGLSQAEVATHMGISERTVEHQVRLGLMRLEAYMHAKGIHSFQVE